MKLDDILNKLKGAGYITICDPNNNIQKLSDIAAAESDIDIILNKLKDAGYITIADPNDNIEKLSDIEIITFTFTINPTPSDATVTIDGQTRTNITASTGEEISWSVSKTGYTTESGVYTMGDSDYTLDVNLAPEQFTFTIVPTPSDATVTINGQTRSSLTADPGTVINWSVSKTNYLTQTGTYTLTEDHTENVQLVESPINSYLTLEAVNDGNITFTVTDNSYSKTIYYSKDNGATWQSLTSTTSGATIPVNNGDKVLLKGTNESYCTEVNSTKYPNVISASAGTSLNLSGNIMSLNYGDNFAGQTQTSQKALERIFLNANINSAENLVMPATTLGHHCYEAMFYGSTIVTPPAELPNSTTSDGCYYEMFKDCNKLTKSPDILSSNLYSMSCVRMFEGCSSLNYIKCLATSFGNYAVQSWTNGVSSTGTFVKASGASWQTSSSGIPSNWTIETA